MFASAIVYSGLAIACTGVVLVVKPMGRLRVPTRRRALAIVAAGVAVAGAGLILPAPESRAGFVATRLDAFAPAWQFNEIHSIHIAAPPARVFDAIRQVRADEITFFRMLTWIRRAGRALPASILDAGGQESLIDLATRTGFVRLADDAPRELVIGTVVIAPPGKRGVLTPERFLKPFGPGFAVATMNFLVTPDEKGGSMVSTETRVFANSPQAKRRFAAYWRVIYPGSAIIRRMWLRAVEQRATRS
jgi:hypothetical protein